LFERYTEKARRIIFFSRYEASRFGSPHIESEHVLLGLLREDRQLTNRFFRSHAAIESIRKQIEGRTEIRDKISTSVDLPLSQECKRVLAYAAEEAERLKHKHIGTEHLLLGLLREEKSFAAELLRERGLSLEKLREELSREEPGKEPPKPPGVCSPLSKSYRDLTQAAMENQLEPLVGREEQLERVIQILCRHTKNNPVLVGEVGVGRKAIVHGLAQRIAGGNAPSPLADKRVLAFEDPPLSWLTGTTGLFRQIMEDIEQERTAFENAIFFVDDLRKPGRSVFAGFLTPALLNGTVQCVASATPEEYRKRLEDEPWIERCFIPVNVPAPSDAEAHQILSTAKRRYEAFHGVTYTDEALNYAVVHSGRFIPERALPGIAIDLMDDAGVTVRLRAGTLPEEVADCKKRISFIAHRMENAIANHELEKARFYSEEERKERENLRQLSEKYKLKEPEARTVTVDDIEEAVARWTGVPIATIRQGRITENSQGHDG
jgi:ATP-dependent Clp protease ATP-binding subunit ClpC